MAFIPVGRLGATASENGTTTWLSCGGFPLRFPVATISMANGPLVGKGSVVHERASVSAAAADVERCTSSGSTCPSRHDTRRAVMRVTAGSGSVGKVLRVLVLVTCTSSTTVALEKIPSAIGLPTCTVISSRSFTAGQPSADWARAPESRTPAAASARPRTAATMRRRLKPIVPDPRRAGPSRRAAWPPSPWDDTSSRSASTAPDRWRRCRSRSGR